MPRSIKAAGGSYILALRSRGLRLEDINDKSFLDLPARAHDAGGVQYGISRAIEGSNDLEGRRVENGCTRLLH